MSALTDEREQVLRDELVAATKNTARLERALELANETNTKLNQRLTLEQEQREELARAIGERCGEFAEFFRRANLLIGRGTSSPSVPHSLTLVARSETAGAE